MPENIGHVIQISGPAVDVQFVEGNMPPIYEALRVTSEGFNVPQPINVILEVEQHLGEAENVVDEQQGIGAFGIAKVLGHGQSGQGHAEPGAGGLGHLAVDQCGLGFFGLAGHNDP